MVRPLYLGTNTKLTPQQNAQNYLTPLNAVNVSVFLNGVAEDKVGKNSTVVQFVDTNNNGKIDKDDIVNYQEKGKQKQSKIVDEKELGEAQISATNVILEDGSVLKTSKQNMFKASSLLNLKENNMTPDATKLLVDTKLPPQEQFKAVNRLNNDCDRVLRRGIGATGKLVLELGETPEAKQNLQDAPASFNEGQTEYIKEEEKGSKTRNKNLLSVTGFKNFIVNPAAVEIAAPLTVTELDKPDWNKGLGIGHYTRLNDDK